jgi:hypothetical protein
VRAKELQKTDPQSSTKDKSLELLGINTISHVGNLNPDTFLVSPTEGENDPMLVIIIREVIRHQVNSVSIRSILLHAGQLRNLPKLSATTFQLNVSVPLSILYAR